MLFRRIDIHAHLNFDSYDVDREQTFARALDAGTAVINVGTDIKTSMEVVAFTDKYKEGVFAIVGQHPVDTDESFDIHEYKELLKHPKVVGIGECGLDYFHLKDDQDKIKQKEIFLKHIELANGADKPLMLHVRDAYGDALEILKANAKVKGNSHFFAGTIDEARAFLDMGYTLSFTGVITFAKQYIELVEFVPLDMMHAETDSPFVSPVPNRGKRNEPANVSLVIEKIARIKKLPVEEVEKALLENARRMWKIEL